MSLRYPSDGFSGDADYVSFKPMKYSSRSSSSGGGGGGYIMICMPETEPVIDNKNDWNTGFSFGAGPIGNLKRDSFGLLNDVTNVDLTKPLKAADKQHAVDKVRGYFDNIGSNIGPLAKQGVIESVGGALSNGMPNQAMSVTTGTIYNPNIELAYIGPSLRTFSMSFRMVPRSAGEAATISKIILEFKKWSAPKMIQGGMYEIPYVWQINFMSGGGQNAYKNKFKLAACQSVSVIDNPSTSF